LNKLTYVALLKRFYNNFVSFDYGKSDRVMMADRRWNSYLCII